MVLRHAAGPEDRQAVCELLGRVFEPGVGQLVERMLQGYPSLSLAHCLLVEDRARPAERPGVERPGGEPCVVSTITLVPQTWSLGGVPLEVANLEFVATDPDYRRRGLVQALHRRFEEMARAGGALLSSVMGIPSFYAQFGYTYGAPLGRGLSLAARETEGIIAADPLRNPGRGLRVREAAPTDLEGILPLWEERTRALDLAAVRDRAVWKHLLNDLSGTRGTWLVVTEESGVKAAPGSIAGVFILHTPPVSGQPNASGALMGLCASDYDATLEAVRWASATVAGMGIERLYCGVPPSSPEHAVLAGLGAREERIYGWQVRVYDWVALLESLRPVLEQRLAASAYRGLTHTQVIDLYRAEITLLWRDGRLETVSRGTEAASGAGGARVRLPEDAFTQLVLGYRSLDELYATRLDVQASATGGARAYRGLMNTLFPPLKAWIEP